MAATLRQRDLAAVLAALARLRAASDPDALAVQMMAELSALIGCDVVSWNDMDPVSRQARGWLGTGERIPIEIEKAFSRHLHQHPGWPTRSGPGTRLRGCSPTSARSASCGASTSTTGSSAR